MVLHPDIQSKAQAQVDAVVGTDRLPDYDDLPSLPYVEAVVMEVLRFHPVIPLSTWLLPLILRLSLINYDW